MTKRKHALISPSGAHRWMVCTSSALLEDKLPDNETDYAREGTLAHSLCEFYLLRKLGRITNFKFQDGNLTIQQHRLYKPEMQGYCRDYADYVFALYMQAVKKYGADRVFVYIELKLSLRRWIKDGFGHLDCAIVMPGKLIVIDFKYGQGVPVDAEGNEQMMLYALGCMHELRFEHSFGIVEMHIYQPRINNFPVWSCTDNVLYDWGENEVIPAAHAALSGEGKFIAGDHCKFCRARPTCRFNAEYMQGIIDGYNYDLPELLTVKEIAKIIKKATLVQDYLKAVEKHALSEALKGKKFPGYKVVEGISRRKIVNENSAIKLLKQEGYEPYQILNTSLKGIGDLEALLGKSDFAKVLEGYIVKPKGAPALVPDSHKGIPYGSAADAFKNVSVDLSDIKD